MAHGANHNKLQAVARYDCEDRGKDFAMRQHLDLWAVACKLPW
jgi:hypothetical protein